jgi:tRNA A37 threonylcarbamoyladenosine dehydratase
MTASRYSTRFAGIQRLYGTAGQEIIKSLHVCVVGLGGVGSWAAEALARSGVGKITLIDHDEVSVGNINRQLAALDSTVGRKKFAVLEERIHDINPECDVVTIDDFITTRNLDQHIVNGHDYAYVIDAIDSIKHKAALIYYCKRNKIPIITTGGAGGLTDPTMIHISDLTRTYNDPLAARVRQALRSEWGWTKNTKRYFGVECVFSSQQPVYPRPDGTVSHEKPGIHGVSLDCRFGYGSATFVTATFGFTAVSRLITKSVKKRLGKHT